MVGMAHSVRSWESVGGRASSSCGSAVATTWPAGPARLPGAGALGCWGPAVTPVSRGASARSPGPASGILGRPPAVAVEQVAEPPPGLAQGDHRQRGQDPGDGQHHEGGAPPQGVGERRAHRDAQGEAQVVGHTLVAVGPRPGPCGVGVGDEARGGRVVQLGRGAEGHPGEQEHGEHRRQGGAHDHQAPQHRRAAEHQDPAVPVGQVGRGHRRQEAADHRGGGDQPGQRVAQPVGGLDVGQRTADHAHCGGLQQRHQGADQGDPPSDRRVLRRHSVELVVVGQRCRCPESCRPHRHPSRPRRAPTAHPFGHRVIRRRSGRADAHSGMLFRKILPHRTGNPHRRRRGARPMRWTGVMVQWPWRRTGPRVRGRPPSANGASSLHLRWDLDGPLREVSVELTVEVPPPVPRLYFWALQADFTDPRGGLPAVPTSACSGTPGTPGPRR